MTAKLSPEERKRRARETSRKNNRDYSAIGNGQLSPALAREHLDVGEQVLDDVVRQSGGMRARRHDFRSLGNGGFWKGRDDDEV
jgi:hypothetical protein